MRVVMLLQSECWATSVASGQNADLLVFHSLVRVPSLGGSSGLLYTGIEGIRI